jgi:2-keto-4-pentenoate hydratase/2-oxohepta-3-ene-1,7-dioic acid hydratase in catechol pathway
MIKQICRFESANYSSPRVAELEGEILFPLAEGAPFSSLERIGDSLALADAKLLPPISPSKIICVGRNYADHASELGNKVPTEPLLFLKPPSSLIASGETIVLPPQSNQVEYEGEIGIVIGRAAKYLKDSDNAFDYIFGFTNVNDVTARDLQRKDVQFTRGKSFDTFCPVGPSIALGIEPSALNVETRLNGLIKQKGDSHQMVFSIEFLVKYISNIMTLLPGDLIASGTPAGVSMLSPGDIVEIEVNGVGILRNSVALAGQR